jgi:hypothetical protein
MNPALCPDKKKTRAGIPPGFRSARFMFRTTRLLPCSNDFPPEIDSNRVAKLGRGWRPAGPKPSLNEVRMPENQQCESNLMPQKRSIGRKTGHKGHFTKKD